MRTLLLSLVAATGLSVLATAAASQDEMTGVRKGGPDSLVLKAGLTAQFEGGFANNDDRLDADVATGRNGGFVNGRA